VLRKRVQRFGTDCLLELIRAARLKAELASELDAFVRDKYGELWQAAQVQERE